MIAIAESFPELHRWIPWAATMPTRDALLTNLEEYDAKFESDSGWHYSLFEIDGGALVGEAGLRPAESEDDLEIGYWVRTDRSGRG
jgi:RimJ/RimL family protein N-acetyltransferase